MTKPDAQTLDALDAIATAKSLNGMVLIATRFHDGPNDDAHAFAALTDAIGKQLEAALSLLKGSQSLTS